MEQEKILSNINAKLGQTSLSQKTISDYVGANLPAEGVEPDDAYYTKHVDFLKSLNGNFSADVARQVNDFKKNYKPLNDTPTPKDSNDTTGKNGNNADESRLEQRLKDLENQLKQQNTNQQRSQLQREVISQADSLKVANKAIWEDAVKSVEVGENDTTDTLVTKAKTAYEKMLKRYVGDGATPYGSSGRQGASKEAIKEANDRREAFKKRMQARGKLPKTDFTNN